MRPLKQALDPRNREGSNARLSDVLRTANMRVRVQWFRFYLQEPLSDSNIEG